MISILHCKKVDGEEKWNLYKQRWFRWLKVNPQVSDVGLHHLDAWKPCFCAGSLTWLEKLGASNQKGTSLIHINSEFQ